MRVCVCVCKGKKMVLIGLSWQNQDLLFDNRPLIYLFIYGSLEKKMISYLILELVFDFWLLEGSGAMRNWPWINRENRFWDVWNFGWCLETAPELLWYCSDVALTLLWRCSDVALTLLWNGPEVAVEEMVAETGHGVTLKWRQVSADVALKRLWDCPETAPERLCIVNLFQWHFHTRRCLVASDKISFSFPLVLSVHLFIDFF